MHGAGVSRPGDAAHAATGFCVVLGYRPGSATNLSRQFLPQKCQFKPPKECLYFTVAISTDIPQTGSIAVPGRGAASARPERP